MKRWEFVLSFACSAFLLGVGCAWMGDWSTLSALCGGSIVLALWALVEVNAEDNRL